MEIINCGSGHDYGICPDCGRGHGHVALQREPATPAKPTKCGRSWQAVRAAEERHANLAQRLMEARENLSYWQLQKKLRSHPLAKAAAGARIIAWTQTRDSLQNQIAAKGLAAITA